MSTTAVLGRVRGSTPCSGVLGVDAYLVQVEVDVIPSTGSHVRFNVVGLPMSLLMRMLREHSVPGI